MKVDWWKIIDEKCTTAHGDSWLTFASRLLPAVGDSSLLTAAFDRFAHIFSFINLKMLFKSILTNHQVWFLIDLLARADQKQKQKWHFWSGFWISKMDLHFWVLEAFKNGLPFSPLLSYWNEEPETKTKTPFLLLFLMLLLETTKMTLRETGWTEKVPCLKIGVNFFGWDAMLSSM